jgi:hypothetical protein
MPAYIFDWSGTITDNFHCLAYVVRSISGARRNGGRKTPTNATRLDR